jgi:hypothetical protein
MLFSLKDDPGELNNRINDPELKDKLRELRRLTDADLEELLELRKSYANQYQLNERADN